MEKLRIIKAACCVVLFSSVLFAQQSAAPPKPSISVVPRPPEAVPKGSCTFGEEGYLQNSDGRNHFTAESPTQVADYITDRMKKGYVVTLYPQPGGMIIVIATCGDPHDARS